MGDIPAIRCYTCNNILGIHYDNYDNLVAGKPMTPYDAFRKMNIDQLRGKRLPSKTIKVPWSKTLTDGNVETIVVEREVSQFEKIDLWNMYGSWLTPEVIANVPLEDKTVILPEVPPMKELLAKIGIVGLDKTYQWALRDENTRKALYHLARFKNPQTKAKAMRILNATKVGMKAFMNISSRTKATLYGCRQKKDREGKDIIETDLEGNPIPLRALCDEKNGRKMLSKFITLTNGERLTTVEALNALGLNRECCRMRMMSKAVLPMGLNVPTFQEPEDRTEDTSVPVTFPLITAMYSDGGTQETFNIPEITSLDIPEDVSTAPPTSFESTLSQKSEAGMVIPVDPLGVDLLSMNVGEKPQGMVSAMDTIDYIEDLGGAELGSESFMRPFAVKSLRRPPKDAPIRGIMAV